MAYRSGMRHAFRRWGELEPRRLLAAERLSHAKLKLAKALLTAQQRPHFGIRQPRPAQDRSPPIPPHHRESYRVPHPPIERAKDQIRGPVPHVVRHLALAEPLAEPILARAQGR